MLNLPLVTLGMAALTERLGLSMALGAFMAGMLISETPYRHQAVEEDIKPFRDVLLGLFFVTIGMLLNIQVVLQHLWLVLALLAVPVLFKLVLITALARLFGPRQGVAIRTGLGLAQAGEFGFVLLNQIDGLNLVDPVLIQVILASMLLSMLAAPFLIQYSDAIVLRFAANEWLMQSLNMTRDRRTEPADREARDHLRLWAQRPEPGPYARARGHYLMLHSISTRTACAMPRPRATPWSMAMPPPRGADCRRHPPRSGHHRHLCQHAVRAQGAAPRPGTGTRAAGDRAHGRRFGTRTTLQKAGATEVVPEIIEGSLMLASHALVLLWGADAARAARRAGSARCPLQPAARLLPWPQTMRKTWSSATPCGCIRCRSAQPPQRVGRRLGALGLERIGAEVTAVRRRGIRALDPEPDTILEAGRHHRAAWNASKRCETAEER
ncbi:cation:proton antiporter domain-containing protein [Cupriavidus basilensis]